MAPKYFSAACREDILRSIGLGPEAPEEQAEPEPPEVEDPPQAPEAPEAPAVPAVPAVPPVAEIPASPAPASPAPAPVTPMLSPMFEVPATPRTLAPQTPLTDSNDSPHFRPLPSPMASPMASPMWQLPEAMPAMPAPPEPPKKLKLRKLKPMPPAWAESECLLQRLFRMPGFHDILLDGIDGNPPRSRRARCVWELLRPPVLLEPETAPLQPLRVPPPPPPPPPPVPPSAEPAPAAAERVERRKRPEHSDVVLRLWGRLISRKRHVTSSRRCTVRSAIPGKRCWSGKSPPSASELSLHSIQPYVLYEYIEEHPTLLMNMGMGHEVFSYYRPRKRSYEGEALGPLQCRSPIQVNGPLPSLLSSQIHLKPGQGISVMDSALLRAPLVCHQASSQQFLLIWNAKTAREGGEAGCILHLRPLASVCVVGQVEPERLVQGPTTKESAQLRSSCIRHMIFQAQRRGADSEQAARSVLQWFPEHLVKAEKKKPLLESSLRDLPESVCLLESMQRGEERLQSLGIDFRNCEDRRLLKALQDLEDLNWTSSLPCARWIMEQLQITPWNLAAKYFSFRKKGGMLAVVGPGDPSNGRMEAISFLPLLVKNASKAEALARLCLYSDELLESKLREKVAEDLFRPLSRWDRIALLCSKLGEPEKSLDCVAGWSRASLSKQAAKQTALEVRKSHQQLLEDAFQRQVAALSAVADDTTLQAALESPEDALLAALESPSKEDDDKEMQRLRSQLGVEKEKSEKKKKVKMLKVVTTSWSPVGQVQERVLYVFGDNIRLYRALGLSAVCPGSQGPPSDRPTKRRAVSTVSTISE